MSATHIDELPENVRAIVLKKVGDGGGPDSMDSESLAAHVESTWLTALSTLRPFIEELWRRFEALADGQTIAGCTTRKEYCERVLNRTPRAVRYMLGGGNNHRNKPVPALPIGETVSPAVDEEDKPCRPRQDSIASDRDSDIKLEPCGRGDSRYIDIRDRHYIPNNGCIGRQAHFLVHFKNDLVGIISGASPVYATKPRDQFFGIANQRMRNEVLNGIVNNSVFRLESHEQNLATRVLRMWRELIPHYWYERYGTVVYGFETFVIETNTRVGTLYKADGWTLAGTTAGVAKIRSGIEKPAEDWKSVVPKLVYCKWRKGFTVPCSASTPAWVRIIAVEPSDEVGSERWDADKTTRRKDREYLGTGGNDPVLSESNAA